ncbi:MAG: tRNA (adenosine(37)-N6)-dimethylallyltransferase MiaA [Rickettsiales bacterium]|nr:tRNA (adenosine(37)-N6)-dimethylallyltransferase MiaA [Pseudomonadota bacterium]MDA0967402.1 tRNA (adenosine(37)-N6)-dimethylallyltransferase MiaA [Pseudomonadota bacterium]MDG4544425.1 tRNA (adenosine(37)-N6)-dimethylallyltransferase MiaA [Rickettsiales bacterium]MDG4546555.1 tRNA (adenosine(37)-N6)-dimethylallyltransferase MiaA [Rickettsiales bacterium]MDG4548701.1 tRNA (adenosine(37)-N6)-dimethylallyltransferase MiaA [Rickettsiales bacterium]
MQRNKPVIILFGPTASGKSSLAMSVASKIDAVIINCDSKQLYKEIPIITAQPTEDEKNLIPHEMYGVISVSEHCSVGRWLDMVKPVIERAWAKGKIPMLVGGTGMYIKYLTQGIPQMPDIEEKIRQQVRRLVSKEGSEAVYAKLDDVMRQKLEPSDRQRVARAYEVLLQTGESLAYWQEQPTIPVFNDAAYHKFFLSPDRQKVYENCNTRFDKMIGEGVLGEMESLQKMNLSEELPSMKSHGVPELLAYLKGDMTIEDAVEQAKKNTRHYIKRQFTWFRGQMSDAYALKSASPENEMISVLNDNL